MADFEVAVVLSNFEFVLWSRLIHFRTRLLICFFRACLFYVKITKTKKLVWMVDSLKGLGSAACVGGGQDHSPNDFEKNMAGFPTTARSSL